MITVPGRTCCLISLTTYVLGMTIALMSPPLPVLNVSEESWQLLVVSVSSRWCVQLIPVQPTQPSQLNPLHRLPPLHFPLLWPPLQELHHHNLLLLSILLNLNLLLLDLTPQTHLLFRTLDPLLPPLLDAIRLDPTPWLQSTESTTRLFPWWTAGPPWKKLTLWRTSSGEPFDDTGPWQRLDWWMSCHSVTSSDKWRTQP